MTSWKSVALKHWRWNIKESNVGIGFCSSSIRKFFSLYKSGIGLALCQGKQAMEFTTWEFSHACLEIKLFELTKKIETMFCHLYIIVQGQGKCQGQHTEFWNRTQKPWNSEVSPAAIGEGELSTTCITEQEIRIRHLEWQFFFFW